MNDTLAVNTLRALTLDAICKAKEGHPGAPLGMAAIGYVLWTKIMRYNPKNPNWLARDRFVLSAGHGSMLQYAALHLTGYDLPLEQIKQFRQWGSATAGHPEVGHTAGVETTTGPLGQGFANAVGMALGLQHLAARYNQPNLEILNNFVYCICSDGDLQEGISHETASLAGHLGLGKLVVLYDDNDIQLDGPTQMAFSEDITARFMSYNWQVLEITEGDTDYTGLENAIKAAQADPRPSLIKVKTTIGYGLPKAGQADVHGKAPSSDDVIFAKKQYGFTNLEPFFIDPEGAAPWQEAGAKGTALEATWQEQFQLYADKFPIQHGELVSLLGNHPIAISLENLPKYETGGKPVRTRNAGGDSINALVKLEPRLIGGSADLSTSNMTVIKNEAAMTKNNLAARNINFGVREFGMAGMANGMSLVGLRPFVATFFTFSDYMKNAIRMAALMHQPVIYVFTHDSIGVGTDGPTHQPIEHLAALRAIPNLSVIRPADANETSVAWKIALEQQHKPTAIVLSRQDLPVLEINAGASKGGYIVKDSDGTPDVILIATGSEVSLALETQKALLEQGKKARVVSLLSWDIFSSQSAEYKESVLPNSIRARVAIEAGSSLGWERYVGLDGGMVTLDRYGASAPDATVFKELGFNVENVVKVVLETIGEVR
ncbi:MAG: transketolase [Deinococcota bacterium]|jgi:transketolase